MDTSASFVSQKTTLPVRNVMALLEPSSPSVGRHGPLLPDSLRALIVGPSGCGKTNVIMSLLLTPNGLSFENLYLYTKSASQPMYEYVKAVLDGVDGVTLHVYSDHDSVIAPDEALANSVFIFDDVATEKQDCIRAYFAAGRHKHHDALYLCQTYSVIPKQLVRDNANFIVAFRQDDRNLDHIYREHVGADFPTFAHFKRTCETVWREPFAFLVIDKTRALDKGRYRSHFDRFLALPT